MLLGQCRRFLAGSKCANPWIGFSLSCLWESKSFLKREAHSNVMVRSPCLSVILVLEFSDRGISQIGSRPDVSIGKLS